MSQTEDDNHYNFNDLFEINETKNDNATFDFCVSFRNAAANGDIALVQDHLERGADIHVMSDYALRHATKNDHFEVVKFLIEKGANIHAEDDYVLHFAIENNKLKLVEFIFSTFKDINLAWKENDNFSKKKNEKLQWQRNVRLIYTCIRNDYLEMLKLLAPKIKSFDQPYFHYAIQEGRFEIVKFLLELNQKEVEEIVERKVFMGYSNTCYKITENETWNLADSICKDTRILFYLIKQKIEWSYYHKHLTLEGVFFTLVKKKHTIDAFKILFDISRPDIDFIKKLFRTAITYNITTAEFLFEYAKLTKEEMNDILESFVQTFRFLEDISEETHFLYQKGADYGLNDNIMFSHAINKKFCQTIAYRFNLVKMLIEEYGADIHFNNDQAIREAALTDHIKLNRYLLSKGADIYARSVGTKCAFEIVTNKQIKRMYQFEHLMPFVFDFALDRETVFSRYTLAEVKVLKTVFEFIV